MKNLTKILVVFIFFATQLLGCSSVQASARSPKVIYEIFPRSFQDSNGDGVGDLAGVISRLDYLNNGTQQSLGVDALWLTPIFRAPSYHGYDAIDYTQLNSEYGDINLFKRLIAESHRRGIRIYLDMAINHTSIQNPWFEASKEPHNPEHGLYLWSPEPLNWFKGIGAWHPLNGEFYYGSFGNTSGSDADLNWRNPEVLQKFISIFRYWSSLGVDGFRLDAAKFLVKGPNGEANVPETHQVWKSIVQGTRQVNPNAYFISEVWDSAENIAPYYGGGEELDSSFDFPVAFGLRDSLVKRNGSLFAQALRERVAVEPTPTFTSPIINNHDMVRISTLLEGDMNRLKLGAVAQLTLAGTPTIYYGDEIGLPEGELPSQAGDLGKRTPMEWDDSSSHGFSSKSGGEWVPFSTNNPVLNVAAQKGDPHSLLNTYRSLLHLRTIYPVLAQGSMSEINQSNSGVVTYIRSFPQTPNGSRILVILNFTAENLPAFSVPVMAVNPLTSGTLLLGNSKVEVSNGPVKNQGHVQLGGLAASTAAIILLK